MAPSPQDGDFGPAAGFIAEICAALQSVGLSEERTRLAESAAAGARGLAGRLAQIEATLDRIEARLAEVEREVAVLSKPSWPF